MKNDGVFDLQIFQCIVLKFRKFPSIQLFAMKSLNYFLANSHVSEKRGHFVHTEAL